MIKPTKCKRLAQGRFDMLVTRSGEMADALRLAVIRTRSFGRLACYRLLRPNELYCAIGWIHQSG
jgi:hypothetical protein